MLRLSLRIVLWLWTSGLAALPHADTGSLDISLDPSSSLNKRGFNNGIVLRTLPLGASIVYGLTSSDGNGFRYGLRNQLVYNGNPVNMIGSREAGTMSDNDVEGWPGYIITQVADKAKLSIPSQPNLVLLHVGTNDCVQDIDIPNAGSRLAALIDDLFAAIDDVTIIASTLLPNGNSGTQSNINAYNSQIPNIVQERQAAGQKIAYVDFSSSYFSLSDIGPDGTHPTDDGYLKMAEVWYQGIEVANDQGWLSAPATVSGLSDTVTTGSETCDKVPGQAIGPTQTQMGSGSDDGAYVHIGVQVSGFAGFSNPSGVNFNNSHPEGVFWADINGDGSDDYIYVGSNSEYGLGVALSELGQVGDYLYSYFSVSCNRPGVHFTDITGDGRADFCCLGPDGGLECWENQVGNDPRSPSWKSLGTVKTSEGYPQAQVRLADIDGDGRTDYVVFDATTSNIYGWRNGALQPGPPQYWYAMRGVFSGLPAHDLAGWQFVDLNGDKKDDLVWVDADGAVTTWINRRGFDVGLGPQWVSHGVTHQGSTYPVNVTFGAFMGSGRGDYSLVSIKNGLVYIDRWENEDHGGTMVRGDGTFYCDMTGSGSDDYVFINSTGAITLFENDHNWGYWIPWGVIFETGSDRGGIRLADFDGDGKCDILIVEFDTGTTSMYQNLYADGKFNFQNAGVVSQQATCDEGWGTDKHDQGVRFHDLDGDGRADYLCMQSDGVTTGFLNKPGGKMLDQGLIKHAEGKERKNLRFADINGDGKDDFLYVDMIDGAVTAWYNGGPIPSSGSAFQWNWQGNVSTGGSSRGECVEFGSLYGVGRADYIVVEPATNKAWTWFNVCPDGVGPVTPDLPTAAPPPPAVVSGVSPGTIVTKTTLTNSNGQPTTLTETLKPVTTTDSRGSTIVITSTDGPETTLTTTLSGGKVVTTTFLKPTDTTITTTLSGGSVATSTFSLTTSTVTSTLSGGSIGTSETVIPVTSTPSSTQVVETFTEPDGSTVVLTLPSGSSSIQGLTTITTDGSTLTVVPIQTVPSGTITSTMTTVPPGLSIQDFTWYPITGNIWVTTTGSDHSSTIVPVILPCATCEPKIVWNLPEVQWTKFQWPSFPKLPGFHLPCIKIFGFQVAGSCPSPTGPPPVNDNPPSQPEESHPPSSATSCTSTVTAKDCEIDCTVLDLGSTTTTQCATSCSTTSGCGITATSTTTTLSLTEADYWTGTLPENWNTVPSDASASAAYAASTASVFSSIYSSQVAAGYIVTSGSPVTSIDIDTATLLSSVATGPPPVTTFASCSTQNPDPQAGISQGYCVCSGSTFAQYTDDAVTPINVCAYTSPLPASTTSISTATSTTTPTPTPTPSKFFTFALYSDHGCADQLTTITLTNDTCITPQGIQWSSMQIVSFGGLSSSTFATVWSLSGCKGSDYSIFDSTTGCVSAYNDPAANGVCQSGSSACFPAVAIDLNN